MTDKKDCPSCELYGVCLQGYKEMPKDESGCEDWELSYAIFETLPDKYTNQIPKIK